jgi:hypothetical protein
MTDRSNNSAPNVTPPPAGDPSPASDANDRGAIEQDLKATANAIEADLGQLTSVEREKESLDGADPRVDDLSERAVDLADRILKEARAERQLGEELR